MALSILATVVMGFFIGLVVRRGLRETTTGIAAEAGKDTRPDQRSALPETLEGVLVRHLLAEEINDNQFRSAMRRPNGIS